MSIHVQFESPDPRLPNNQLKDECETAGKGHEINVPHRSIISQTMAERILHHHKNLRRNSKVWNEFLSLKPDIVRRPDFSRGDLPLDTSHYSGYSLGLVAQCSSVAVEAAKPCRCCESSGTFKSCRQIIWPGRGYLWGGCCVGCRFNRSAKLCSFHANYVDKGPSRRRSKGTPRTQPRGRPRRQAQMPQSRVETPPVAKLTPPVVLELGMHRRGGKQQQRHPHATRRPGRHNGRYQRKV
ncbi:hypothetical protein BC567DRAFT_16413 [Phyllosticta citribraziliensis]